MQHDIRFGPHWLDKQPITPAICHVVFNPRLDIYIIPSRMNLKWLKGSLGFINHLIVIESHTTIDSAVLMNDYFNDANLPEFDFLTIMILIILYFLSFYRLFLAMHHGKRP